MKITKISSEELPPAIHPVRVVLELEFTNQEEARLLMDKVFGYNNFIPTFLKDDGILTSGEATRLDEMMSAIHQAYYRAQQK